MPGWRSGRPYQRWLVQVRNLYGDVCHLCGHAGAYEADHLTPLAVWPDQPYDPQLARPAHGTSAPCPVCKRQCNQERGASLLEQQYEPDLRW